MSYFVRIFVCILFVFIICKSSYGEGAKEVMPLPSSYGKLQIMSDMYDFAMYNCSEESRLNIRVNNSNEKICLGFGLIKDYSGETRSDVKFRIKDPNGNVIYGPASVPTNGTGFISNHNKAVLGPDIVNSGGYNPIIVNTTSIGDYYIEFEYSNNLPNDRREFNFFDFTVVDAFNNAKPGRVWSNAWVLTVSATDVNDPFSNYFDGKLFIYADDGIVTSVNFNGMRPLVFSIVSNSYGVVNSGNIINDRKSRIGEYVNPQYKIFLNNPDEDIFPTGTLGSFTEPSYFTGCSPDDFCFNLSFNMSGTAEIFINNNDEEGYQINSEDILIVAEVEEGHNCIPFDGLDGLGEIIPSNTLLEVNINFYNGVTHLPLYDVEYLENGLIVEVIRPLVDNNSTPKMFWDDSNISSYSTVSVDGCVNTAGCHSFADMFGDENTINTWWYASNAIDYFDLFYEYITVDANTQTPLYESNDTTVCINDLKIELHGAVTYADGSIWYGGTGQYAPDNTSLNFTYTFSEEELINNEATLYLETTDNNNCPAKVDTIVITIEEPDVDIISDISSGCQPLKINFADHFGSIDKSYVWDLGHNYVEDTMIISSNPYHTYTEHGYYTVEVEVTTANGCKAKDSKEIEVYKKPKADFFADPFVTSILKPDVTFYNLSSSNIEQSYWDFNDGNNASVYAYEIVENRYENPGVYNVNLIVETEKLCKDTVVKEVIVKEPVCVYVPTAFTPDGDSKNDFFIPKGSGIDLNNYTLYVYNRWGELVFTSNDFYRGWNGMCRNVISQNGVYMWLINFKDIYGQSYQKAGEVTLIR